MDAEGFHPLCSQVAFADLGDLLIAQPAERFAFSVEGPFAAGLGGDDDLVVRAVDAMVAALGGTGRPPVQLTLHKALPIASGLGGGTADGVAAIRCLRAGVFADADEAVLRTAAAALGSDGPACLAARPAIMEGRGDRLLPGEPLPALPAVLVNPGVACPTGAVYRAYDAAGASGTPFRPPPPPHPSSIESVAAWLGATTRNDLEAPAIGLVPAIGEVLDLLREQPETMLARMSGSGASCFALAPDAAAAARLAQRVAALKPGWWVRACSLDDASAAVVPTSDASEVGNPTAVTA